MTREPSPLPASIVKYLSSELKNYYQKSEETPPINSYQQMSPREIDNVVGRDNIILRILHFQIFTYIGAIG